MEKETLSRREREKLWQRQEILNAAVDLFSEKGFQNVSMQEIAEKSEFAIGTLYKFFQNKEHLYKDIILEHSQSFHDEIMRALEESGDEVEKLRNFVRTKGELFRNDLQLIRLYLTENRGLSYNFKANLDEEVRKGYCDNLEQIAAIFKSGINNGRFKKIAEPYYLAASLDNIVNTFLFLWLENPERHPYPENPDTILNILFEGLITS